VDEGAADDRREERERELLDRLRAENAALRGELERMRARYDAPIEPPAPTKARRQRSRSDSPSSAQARSIRRPVRRSKRGTQLARRCAGASRRGGRRAAGATTATCGWSRKG
jgi:hypothetical protein